MLVPDGEERLRAFTETAYPPTITEVVPGMVYHVMGHGHSNASFIIADTSVILIDALDTDTRGARLAGIIAEHTDKPVKTIIYTHGHPDHRGGAGAFAATNPEVIAFAPARPLLERTEQISAVLDRRGTRQFGYELTDDEAISQGIGPREGIAVGDGVRAFLPPTTVYTEPQVDRTIDGVSLQLRATPGEAEDQCCVWLAAHKVLFCGDTYYGCWPNLYAIRGGQYRDIAGWIASLDLLRAYPADALLPGHTRPIIGREAVVEVLTTFRNALDYVLSETLACMERGLGLDETAAAVTLPAEYRDLPYLQEFYGTVAWSVRGIYTGYLGWFDGNPTHLNPLAPREFADRMVAQLGGPEAVRAAIDAANASGEYQWALELVDLLLAQEPDAIPLKRAKATALTGLGRQETSANGRHYYLACARELLDGAPS
jgi:alkyl sulfatase BDS1-like metallo-beta-lactamase superfamily hydrolase